MASKPRTDAGEFQQEYSDEEVFDALQTLAAKYGRPPTDGEFDDWAEMSRDVVYERWGSWAACLRDAGLDPDQLPVKRGGGGEPEYSDKECLEWINAFVEYFDVVPAHADLTGWPGPCQRTYERRFGSVAQAVREAGYTPRRDA